MPVRDTLPPILRGDEATALTPDDRERLELLVAEAAASGQLVAIRDEAAARMRQANASHAVDYLLAGACALNGEVERAHQTLLALGEKLALAKRWEPLAAVAERALSLEETDAAARLLVRAHEGLKKDPARIEALGRAWALLPDDLELGLLLAVRLGEARQGDQRRAMLAELLPRFAAEKRYAGLEETALEFVEHEDVEALVRLLQALPVVAGHGAFAEARQLLDIAFPPVAKAGRAGEAHEALREVAKLAIEANGAGAGEPFRAAVVESLRQGPARALPDARPVLKLTGVEDDMKPLLPSLERFDGVAALPPGRAVLHGSFGAGRIQANDGETVIIDFAKSRGHKMPYAAAKRSLTPLAEDDLRLLQLADPGAIEKMRKEQQGEMLVRALKCLGGDADANKLKVFLVGAGLVPPAEWTAYFRKARAAAEKDPRIDHARAFEQFYRLAPTGAAPAAGAADDTPLPPLQPRKPIKTNLTTMRKFLAQHPQAETALAGRFGRYFERAMLDPEADRVDRARAGLYVARWYPHRVAEWIEVLRSLWEQGLAVTELSGEDEQLALLETSHAAGIEADAILSALDSRFSAVQDAAARFRENLGAAGRDALRATMLEHSARYPAAAVRLIERELSAATPPADGWSLLWAALSLIEGRPKPSVAERVLGWIAEGGAFDKLLGKQPCPEERVLKTTVLLRQWHSSDRYLFPALELAQRLGLGDAVASVRAQRERNTQKLFDQVGRQADVELPVMTRATWELLNVELQRLERELRTTIPATIQKARELGDLRENAEYHSAKLKQANVSKQVRSLQLRLTKARFVDDATLADGVVGLGTEVVLEGDADFVTYWILGEGEQHHGDTVISFQSNVGRALMGKTIGAVVDLGEGEEQRRYRVVSVERKLPKDAARSDAPA